MGGVATKAIIADVIENRNMFSFTIWNWTNQPSIHKSMNPIKNLINANLSISTTLASCPNPTARDRVNVNFFPNPICRFRTYIINNEIIHTPIIKITPDMSRRKRYVQLILAGERVG